MFSSTSTPRVVRPSTPESEHALLPSFLLGPTALLWLWVLPTSVLLFLNVQGFRLVEGNMDSAQRSAALWLGLSGLGNVLAGVTLFVVTFLLGKSRGVSASHHPGWALTTIVVQVAYLGFALASMTDVLPMSVRAWMYPEEHFMFNQFALAMLPLFLGILRLVATRTLQPRRKAIAISLGAAIAAPTLLFFIYHGLRLFKTWDRLAGITLVTTVIVVGVVMFVGLCRGVLLVLQRTRDWGAKGERAAIFGFAFVLPIAGLMLNRIISFPVDLQAWEVYALVTLNTSILLVASYQHAQRPCLTFNLLCGTLPFSLYFFIVFLPFTPLSVLALVAFGAGFLVLAPVLLFILHLHLLKEAWLSPLLGEHRGRILTGGIFCFLLLPAFFTARGLADKAALNAALDYVYTPAIGPGNTIYSSNRPNLARALRNHRSYKDGIFYPLLSGYYSWLVFDNLVLPDDKLARLETVFFGRAGFAPSNDPFLTEPFGRGSSVRGRWRMPRATPPPRTVEVRELDLHAATTDEQATTVTLKLTLNNTGQGPAEYVKLLPLPAGLFVSGFRLHINGVPVPGRIVEKKTALWVYSMIRDSERRDPGLLFYNAPDQLELRVFPVATDAPSVVEIDVLVPAVLSNDALTGNSRDPAEVLTDLARALSPQLARNGQGVYLAGGLEKQSLPEVKRESYLHLLIDRSEHNGYIGDWAVTLRELKKRFPEVTQARVTLANYNVIEFVDQPTGLDQLPALSLKDLERLLPLTGGFAADLALAHALRRHAEFDLDRAPPSSPPLHPIYIILSQKVAHPALDLRTTEAWADLVSGLDIQELGTDGSYVVHRSSNLATTPLLQFGDSVRPLLPHRAVHFSGANNSGPVRYWSPEASTWQLLEAVTLPPASSAWTKAAALQLQHQNYARSPGDAPVNLRGLVLASREAGVLLPATSYIVVENSAQWRMLELSEGKKLDQNSALNFRETPTPSAVIVLLGFGVWLGIARWRRNARVLADPGRTPAR